MKKTSDYYWDEIITMCEAEGYSSSNDFWDWVSNIVDYRNAYRDDEEKEKKCAEWLDFIIENLA